MARRPLLKRLGATGLATSAAVFASTATAKSASADTRGDYGCCSLANSPSDFDNCVADYDYLWSCSMSGTLHCSCCEGPGWETSAYHCQYN
jgi:hypothetical protein